MESVSQDNRPDTGLLDWHSVRDFASTVWDAGLDLLSDLIMPDIDFTFDEEDYG